jgi:hypothetical protein
MCPGRHIYVPADICGPGVDSGTSRPAYSFFWPVFTPPGRHIVILSFLGRSKLVLSRVRHFPVGSGHFGPRMGWCSGAPASRLGWRGEDPGWAGGGRILARPARFIPGWAGSPLSRLGPVRPIPAWTGTSPAAGPACSILGWAGVLRFPAPFL